MNCAYCKLPITDVRYKRLRGKDYHPECYEAAVQAANERRKKKREANSDATNLESYLRQIFRCSGDLPQSIQSQLKWLESQQKLTPLQIWQSLYYFYTIRGNKPPIESPNIGIVPYIKDEAQRFFEDATKAAEAQRGQSPANEHVTVRMKPPSTALPTQDIDKL